MTDDTTRTPPDDGPPSSDREKIERLHAIAAEMMACRTEREVYQLTVAAAERVLEFDICGIDAVEDGWFVPKAVSSEMADTGYDRAPVEEAGLAGEAYRTGETIVTDDVRDSEVAEPAAAEYRSVLTVPVGDLGVFQAAAREAGVFDGSDRELAELLLTHTEEALRRIRFEAALQERNRTIEQLHETAAELVACESEAAVYELVVAAAEEVLEFRVCVVAAAPIGDPDALEVTAATDDEYSPEPGARVRDDRGVAWRTYGTGESMVVPDIEASDIAEPYHEAYRSVVSVPLGDVGVLQAIATDPGAFDEDDRELAELLASQAGEVVSRLRAERRRVDERDRLAALFHNVPNPVVSLDFRGSEAIVREVNPAFEEVFGYDEATAVGRDLGTLIVPEEGPDGIRNLDRSIRREGGFHLETARRTADGELREFLLHVVPVEPGPDDHDAFAIYTDITDRKRREQRLNALHESTRELMAADDAAEVCEVAVEAARETLGLSLSGVHLLEDGRLAPVAWTDAAEALFDGPPPSYDPDDADIWDVYEAGEQRVFDDVEPEYVEETPVERVLAVPLGERGVFLSAATEPGAFDDQVVDLAGVLAATVETALDRTERERVLRERERELQRQNERLEQFASVVSHDLRSPLSVAEGNLDLARETGEEQFFENVEDAHDRMEALIDDLLALARGGRVAGDTEPIALREAASRAWTDVDAPAAAMDGPDDGELEADPDRLVQLLRNLFVNAVEHGSTSSQQAEDAVEHGSAGAPSQGREDAAGTSSGEPPVADERSSSSPGSQARQDADAPEDAAERDDGVEIDVGWLGDGPSADRPEGFYVADDGPGIPAEERNEVFEYGYTTAEGGTGLGLAIVRQIAEAHGWDVRVTESEAGGARFEVETG